jgi:CBS domain-containing protein
VKVVEIMSRGVITVTPETGIKVAARLLVERGITALPVVEADGSLVGIVSEADLLSIEARPDPRSQATPLSPTAGSAPRMVSEVMTREVIVVNSNTEVSRAARIMLEGAIKTIPVVRGRRLVGILSRRDLVKVIARRDEDIEAEVTRKLLDLGAVASTDAVSVSDGAVTIEGPTDRRLTESVALTVPGVLEVRFTTPKSSGNVRRVKTGDARER